VFRHETCAAPLRSIFVSGDKAVASAGAGTKSRTLFERLRERDIDIFHGYGKPEIGPAG